MAQFINSYKERSSKMSQLSTELVAAAFGAAKDGDLEEMRLLFSPSKMIKKDQIKMMINAKDKEGNSLLIGCIHGAATNNPTHRTTKYFDCISFLISFGISPDEKDNSGRTAVHWCVLYGRLDLLDFLYRSGANLNVFDGNGLTCLHLAIGIRSEKLRDKFVEYMCRIASKELLDALDSQKRSALFLAFSIGALKIFEYLLLANVSPNDVGPDGRQIIIHTIEKGQGKFTQILLKHGASLSTYDPDGFTAIHLAACQENPENIFVLTECVNKTLLSVKDNLGRTPLMYACLMGFDKNVQILLHQKIWILDQDNDGKTALHHTVNNTHCGCAELLCKENKKIINMSDNEGCTAAHDAVIAGNSILLEALLANKCDVNARDNGGHLLMHWIAAYGTVNCLDCLLKYEANFDEADNHGATPLHYGCQKDDKDDLTNNRTQLILILLQNGARLSTADKEGRKPIHWASSSGNISALKMLLKFGDDVNSATLEEKMTPLHLASFQGMTNIVSFLVNQKNIIINARDKIGCTALFYACTSGHASVAEILLKIGANPDLADKDGESPSHCAAAIGSVSCLELLLNTNADLASKNNRKETPIHEAASAGKSDAILFLLKNGCQPTLYNSTGATPLHYSAAEGHIDSIKILLEHKAKVNALVITKESDYVTALDIALGNNDLNSIQLLQQYGARTGYSIAENSVLIIQNRWKIFKRRYSGMDSSLKSYLNDSVSVTEKPSDIKNDNNRKTMIDDGNGSKDKENEDTAIMHNHNQDKSQTADCDKDLKESSENEDKIKCEILNDRNGYQNDRGNHDHDEVLKAMEKDVLNQVLLSNAECERSDRLMDRINKLKKKIQIVHKETNEIASSSEFRCIKELNERYKERGKSLRPKLVLPELSSRISCVYNGGFH